VRMASSMKVRSLLQKGRKERASVIQGGRSRGGNYFLGAGDIRGEGGERRGGVEGVALWGKERRQKVPAVER